MSNTTITIDTINSIVSAVASAIASTNSVVTPASVVATTSVATTSVTPASVNGQIVSFDDIDVHDKTRSIILLTELDVATNQMMNIIEKYHIESFMKGLNSFLCYAKDYNDAFYRLPEEYRNKAIKKTEEWSSTLTGNDFEGIVSSYIEFSRGLYRDLLAEAMNN